MSLNTDEVKSIFASKTFWVNAIACIAAILSMTGHGLPAEIATPEAQAETIAGLMPIINIVLRAITSTPVTVLGNK